MNALGAVVSFAERRVRFALRGESARVVVVVIAALDCALAAAERLRLRELRGRRRGARDGVTVAD